MIRRLSLTTALVTLLIPQAALAYLNPEDVLLNRELFLPPTARESQSRTELQAQEAAARREREQDAAFTLQQPEPEPVVVEEDTSNETMFGSAPEGWPAGFVAVPMNSFYGQPTNLFGSAPPANTATDAANLELMRTMRLLDRVQQNQQDQVVLHHAATLAQLHGGAPPLSDTGPGAYLAAATMLGAITYTLYRAKRSNKAMQVFSV